MKILFICGAFEPGRDGVGDYTRRLAGAVHLMGHQSSVIALYDAYISREVVAEQPADAGVRVHALRIPEQTSHTNRFRRVKEWVDLFAPDWISLQFVPYSYHPKGMPFLLCHELQKLLVNDKRLQIMFHETWIGVEGPFDLKRRLIAALQKSIIRRLIQLTRPAVIHTQLPVTLKKLEAMAPGIRPLPLFSNIDVSVLPAPPNPAVLRAGFFSQAATSPAILSFLKILSGNAAAAGRRLEILFIGGDAAKMKMAGDAIGKENNFENNVHYTGFLPPEGISAAIQSCDVGITLVPRHALGKSGSVAAFLQHGIPVAAPVVHDGEGETNIGFFSANLCAAIVLTPGLQELANAGKAATGAKDEIGLPVIAKIFIENICSVT